MDGLAQIIGKIKAEGEQSTTDILSAAQKQAEQIIAEGRETAKKQADARKKDTKKQCEQNLENARSASAMAEKKAMLSARSDALHGIISDAAKRLCSLPDADYFAALAALITRYCTLGKGTLRLNAQDLARLPGGFIDRLNARLTEKNSALTLAKEPADITGGFLLCYGDIEQNCSFEALISEQTDDLMDELNARIFD